MTHRKETDELSKNELSKLLQRANESIINLLTRFLQQPSSPTIPFQQPQPTFNNLEKQMSTLSIFDKIQDIEIDQTAQTKINNHKLQLFTPKRKDLLFGRFKNAQERQFVDQRAQMQKKFIYSNEPYSRLTYDMLGKTMKSQFTLQNESLNKSETFPINNEDMEKLKAENDLNDVIIGTYIKLIQFVYLPVQTDQKTHIFSSFFMDKLIGELGKEEYIYDKESAYLVDQVRVKTRESYKNVKRWTKKFDIFEKERLVFPINAFRHWFCIFVLNPNTLITKDPRCQIVYCDSMFQGKEFVVQAIRNYLQFQLQDKKNIKLDLGEDNLPYYQLLLPRQTNTHDCGLYMVSYIEELLLHPYELENLQHIQCRHKLRLFPRLLIYTMRDRLRKLFTRLLSAKDEGEKSQILADYSGEKERILKQADDGDFDSINEKEYRKYEKMNLMNVGGASPQQKSFALKIKFYLDPEINFYEKDK